MATTATTNLMSLDTQPVNPSSSASTRTNTAQRTNSQKYKKPQSNNKSFDKVFNKYNDATAAMDNDVAKMSADSASVQDTKDPITAAITTSAQGKSKKTQDAPQKESQSTNDVNEIEENEELSTPKTVTNINLFSFVSMSVEVPVQVSTNPPAEADMPEENKQNNLMTILPKSQESSNKGQDMLNLLAGRTWDIKPKSQPIEAVNVQQEQQPEQPLQPMFRNFSPISMIRPINPVVNDAVNQQVQVQGQPIMEDKPFFPQNIPTQRAFLGNPNINVSEVPLNNTNAETDLPQLKSNILPTNGDIGTVKITDNTASTDNLSLLADEDNSSNLTSPHTNQTAEKLTSIELSSQNAKDSVLIDESSIAATPNVVSTKENSNTSQPIDLKSQSLQSPKSEAGPIQYQQPQPIQPRRLESQPLQSQQSEIQSINPQSVQNQQIQAGQLSTLQNNNVKASTQPLEISTQNADEIPSIVLSAQNKPADSILSQQIAPQQSNIQTQTQNQNSLAAQVQQTPVESAQQYSQPQATQTQVGNQYDNNLQQLQANVQGSDENQAVKTIIEGPRQSVQQQNQPLQQANQDSNQIQQQTNNYQLNQPQAINYQPIQQQKPLDYQPVQMQQQEQPPQIQYQPQVQTQQSNQQIPIQPANQVEIIEMPQVQAAVSENQEVIPNRQQTEQSNLLNVPINNELELDSSQVINPSPQTSQQQSQNPQQNLQSSMQQAATLGAEIEQSSNSAQQSSNETFATNLGAAVNNTNNQPLDMPADPIEQATRAANSEENITTQIVEHAKMIRTAENTEMVIHLKPEHLGELTLRVSVTSNGSVNASFISENAQVRAMIENTMVQLKQELANQGIKVDSVQVYSGLEGNLMNGKGQQAWEQNQRGNNSSRVGRLGRIDSSKLTGAEETEIVSSTVSENTLSSDGVDYRV